MLNTRSRQTRLILIAIVLLIIAFLIYGPMLLNERNAQATPTEPTVPTPPIALANPEDINYIAVGDSYTIGTGTTPDHSWPADLVNALHKKGIKIELTGNLGVDGYTTRQAIDNELGVLEKSKPTFATLMIGVNDTYNPTTPEEFQQELEQTIDRMQAALPNKSHLILVTIPDFSVTPRGMMFASMNNAKAKISQFNDIIKAEGHKRALPVVDLYSLSQEMATDRSLRAKDQLHPSAKEYHRWEKMVFPAAYKMLKS